MSKIPATILSAPFWILGVAFGIVATLTAALGMICAIAGHLIQEAGNDKVK